MCTAHRGLRSYLAPAVLKQFQCHWPSSLSQYTMQSFKLHFKIILLIYKALNGLAPPYISDSLLFDVPSRALRSFAAGLFIAPHGSQKKIGDAAFNHYASKLWNTLPIDIRTASSVDIFKRQVKSFPF